MIVTSSAASADSPIDPPLNEGPQEDPQGPSVAAWVESLGTGTENDTMLRFTPSQHNAIDLTEANASGLMQMLGGRRTRLSTLLNEPAAFETGAKAAAAIRSTIRDMREDRGIEVGFLAAGIASWSETTEAGEERFTAPVMLLPISLRTRADTQDFELQLEGHAGLNPALARHMRRHHGLTLDADEFFRAGYATARFDPSRTAELLTRTAHREAPEGGSPLGALQVWRQLYVSTFADLAELGNPQAVNTDHPVLRHLAAGTPLDQDQQLKAVSELPELDSRSPGAERLVADADAHQQQALDAILSGVSAVISSPPGTGQTQTAINAAAGLAWSGKRVLVVAERTFTHQEFAARLSAAQMGTLAVNVPASSSPHQVGDQLVRAIKRAERAEPPRQASLHKTLMERRHQLTDHVASLHKVRTRWSCSPYQAMQALAALTALTPAPATTVRLKRSVLDNTVERGPVAIKLTRLAELGAFSEATQASPWFGAKLAHRQETADAVDLVRRLRRDVPHLRQLISAACQQTGLAVGESFTQWHAQVLLFQRVQESLGRFSHDVYARDVKDLIAATAPGWWRRQHQVEMTSMARSRLRRVAKEYIRPGGAIHDLHTSLVEVQTEREEWVSWAKEDAQPSVPRSLDRLVDQVSVVQGHLEKLAQIVRRSEGETSLFDLHGDDLVAVVERLDEDEHSLRTLPERTLVKEQLSEQGFTELVEDLAARHVAATRVADELELAWWQSALEAMVSGDEYLEMASGENLRTIEQEYRAADAAHVASGAQRLSHTLAVTWKSAVEEHPQAAARLRGLLKDSSPTVAEVESLPQQITQPLVPIWTTSPLGLSAQFPEGGEPSFDTVILLDAETLAVPAALGAITRAHQVVAFGDPVSGAPKPMSVSADPIAREAEDHVPDSIYGQLSRIVPEYRLREVHRGVDQELTQLLSEQLYDGELVKVPCAAQLTGTQRRLSLEYVDSTVGRHPVESPTAEVNRVVDLVFDHVRSRRNRSLAVVTGSARHAKRVADAIRLHLANHPWARPFFDYGAAGIPGGSGSGAAGVGTGERFVVAPVERAHGVVRDDVIFALGYGRSVKGDPAHEFGELSGPRGPEYFAQAVTRARGRLTVVSSLRAAEVDMSEHDAGGRLVHQLLQLGDALSGTSHGTGAVTDPLVLDLVDRIRARGGRVEDGFQGLLDLAACPRKMTPDSRVRPVAMISDGSQRYADLSVRERSRLRPARFEEQGWQYMVLWTIEVFSDPSSTTERVADAVGISAGPEFAHGGHGQLTGHTGPVRFGGAADADDEEAHRRSTQWLSPRERRWDHS